MKAVFVLRVRQDDGDPWGDPEVTHHEPYRREKEKALAGSVVCWRHTRIDEATGNYIYAR